MLNRWRVLIYHPDYHQALALYSLIAHDWRFQIRIFTQRDSASDFFETQHQDIALIYDDNRAGLEESWICEILERHTHMPIIALYDEQGDGQSEENDSLTNYLPLPCTAEVFTATLEKFLEIPVVVDRCQPIGIPSFTRGDDAKNGFRKSSTYPLAAEAEAQTKLINAREYVITYRGGRS